MTDWSTDKYKKEDFKKISWDEYSETIDILTSKIDQFLKKQNLKISAVVPILRGGGIPGIALAYKLHILKVLPVQYKYFYTGADAVVRKIGGACDEDFKKLGKPTLLVVENNRCFGTTSIKVIEDLKMLIPEAKILYAAAYNDYSYQNMPGAEVCFFGRLTNEARELSFQEAKKKDVTNDLSLFPWEDLEEEWDSVQLKGFKYQDEET